VRLSQPLAAGAAHTAIVTAGGALVTMGLNQHGQCGQQRTSEVAAAGLPSGAVPPGRVHALAHEEVQGVACGGAHTLALTSHGTVYAFGLNACGQLGCGTISPPTQPCPSPHALRLPAQMRVAWVAAGEEFSACVTQQGEVLTWGFGGAGQLGHGNSGSMRLPRQVACAPCLQVSCGGGHVYARTASDGLLGWGFPGTWSQLKRQQAESAATTLDAATAQADGGEQLTAGHCAARSGAKSRRGASGGHRPPAAAAPDWRPRVVDLLGYEYQKVVIGGLQVAPTRARRLAAGRHFAILLADPIAPIADEDAASLIQATFRRDGHRAAQREERQRAEQQAAAVITDRASHYVAKKRIANAHEAKARDEAAARVQAHQRRRAEQREVIQRKQRQADAAAAEVAKKRVVISATGVLAPASKHLLGPGSKDGQPIKPIIKPTPPQATRVGGGFTRKSKRQ